MQLLISPYEYFRASFRMETKNKNYPTRTPQDKSRLMDIATQCQDQRPLRGSDETFKLACMEIVINFADNFGSSSKILDIEQLKGDHQEQSIHLKISLKGQVFGRQTF